MKWQALSGEKVFWAIHAEKVGQALMKARTQISARGSSGPKKTVSQMAVIAASARRQPFFEMTLSIPPAAFLQPQHAMMLPTGSSANFLPRADESTISLKSYWVSEKLKSDSTSTTPEHSFLHVMLLPRHSRRSLSPYLLHL